MTPAEIHAELKKNGFISSDVARALRVSRMSVSNVINGKGKSRRIAEAIAKLTGKTTDELWPGFYPENYQRASKAEANRRIAEALLRLSRPAA
jgi:lambda repressor-like predicted transcriptional regulator